MVFIPKEAQEKIQALEAENKKLQEDLANLEFQQTKDDSATPKKSNGSWVFVVLLLVVILAVTQFIRPVWQSETQTDGISADSLVTLQTELERFKDYEDLAAYKSAASDSPTLVYRVQIGAYKGNPVKGNEPNLEELYFNKSGEFEAVSLGAFTNLERAQAFQNICAEMGLTHAYVVAFKEGKMQPLLGSPE